MQPTVKNDIVEQHLVDGLSVQIRAQ
jgi:hypothetical protein